MTTDPKTRKGQATKTKMIQTAAQLIHKNGVSATTVNDVLEVSSTGKSQFSHYFGSKEALVKDVIDYHRSTLVNESIQQFSNIHSTEDFSSLCEYFKGKAAEFLELYNAGCPLGQISLEVSGSENHLIEKLKLSFEDLSQALSQRLKALQEAGELDKNINTDEISEFMIATIQGGFLLSKVDQSTKPIERCLSHCCQYLKQFVTDHRPIN